MFFTLKTQLLLFYTMVVALKKNYSTSIFKLFKL